MTRKHFIAAAAQVKALTGTQAESAKALIADEFATLFARFNPNFNPDRFYKACGL